MLFLITQPNFQGKHSKECFIISVVAMAVFFDLVAKLLNQLFML